MKSQESIKECYTEEELQVLLKKPNIKKCKFPEYRNWVMTCFLIATGVRIGSLVNIQIKDIDLQAGTVILAHTKNKRAQAVYIPASLCNIIKEHLRLRQGKAEDYLFCNEVGNFLNSRSASHALAKYNKSRGINKTSCHLYRHTMAKNYILNGGNAFMLQKMLGHSTITVSQKYANIYDKDMQQDMIKFNLFDRLQQDGKTIKMK